MIRMQKLVSTMSITEINEEGNTLTLKETDISGLKELIGYSICDVTDTENERHRRGFMFVLQKEIPGGGYTYRDLLFSGKRKFISDEY